jgi:RNA polymerase sigma-70 factor, ECF subfamily
MSDLANLQYEIRGDLKSQKQLYEQYSGQMYSVCLRYCRNEHMACDALHDGFIKVFNHMSKYVGNGDFGAWIRRIMVNTCIDLIRLQQKMQFSELSIDFDEKPIAFQEMMTYDVLLTLLDTLPTGNRMVFTMFVIDGMEHHEIAQVLHIHETTSRTHLFKARKKLQELINKNANLYI